MKGWSVTSPTGAFDLRDEAIGPGQPLAVDLPQALIGDAGGILSLLSGSPASGWSSSFAP